MIAEMAATEIATIAHVVTLALVAPLRAAHTRQTLIICQDNCVITIVQAVTTLAAR